LIHVIYVINEDNTKTDVLHHWNETEFIMLKRKELIIPIEDKLEASTLQYETKIIRGNPGPTIVQYANDHQFDLIVIGSRGLNSLQEFVLGSVSHKVAKRANCSVLIVR